MNPDTTPVAEAEPILRQLLNQAQLISQLRRDLDSLAHEATDSLAGLVSRLEDVESRTVTAGRAPTSWCWRTIGSHGAEELWTQLTGWVAWIRNRYPLARKIPPCWADHPELVEEFTALAAADWHDRWLPGVLIPARARTVRPRLRQRAPPQARYDVRLTRSRSPTSEDSSRAMMIDPSLVTLRPDNSGQHLNIGYDNQEIGHLKFHLDGRIAETWAIQ